MVWMVCLLWCLQRKPSVCCATPAAAGMKTSGFQQGTESAEVLALAGELGLNIVARKCILM